MSPQSGVQIADFGVIEHFGDGHRISEVVVFDLHHIPIEALVGCVEMGIWIFVGEVGSKGAILDQILDLETNFEGIMGKILEH